MTDALLSVQNISKEYGEKNVLHNISLNVHKGELVCLLGVSGIGKTTLFNIISGLLVPDSGKVILNDKDITGVTGNVSYMLQKDMLLPWYTVLDNTALPLLIKGMKKTEAHEKASSYFSQFGIDGTQKQFPSELSGGMKQRAALLRTYLFSAELALLDEPFSALDAITKSQMHSWYLDVMQKIKLSTIFITHDIDEAILLSDRIYILGGSPGTITSEIKIDVSKPRSKDFSLTQEFLKYKKMIIDSL